MGGVCVRESGCTLGKGVPFLCVYLPLVSARGGVPNRRNSHTWWRTLAEVTVELRLRAPSRWGREMSAQAPRCWESCRCAPGFCPSPGAVGSSVMLGARGVWSLLRQGRQAPTAPAACTWARGVAAFMSSGLWAGGDLCHCRAGPGRASDRESCLGLGDGPAQGCCRPQGSARASPGQTRGLPV